MIKRKNIVIDMKKS